jgi:hypothetical protein
MANKGLSYGELIVDNIIGLDNEYESFGEKLGKTVNKDEIGFLKDSAVGIYEGAKEFITSPIDTTKEVVTNIKDSVQRLGTQDLNTRLKNMYGIGYESATDDQVSAAREAVFGDALTALELIPAAKATVVAAKAGTAAIPSGVKADVVGQTKALFSGDKEFLQGTPSARSATQSLSAGFTGSTPPTYLKRDNPFIEDRGEALSWDQVPFEIADDQLNLLNTKLLMFREPIVEFAETVAIPKKGLLGSQFLAQIKNNESIPETSLQEGIIEPSKRYTKEELLKALGKGTNTQGTFRSVANIADDRLRQFETYQRQKSVAFNGGTEQSYFDIPLDSTVGYPGKKFKANEQHYNPETLVHVRGSIINPSSYGFQRSVTFFDNLIEDEDYLLVEELQSDLLTKGYIKPKNKFDAQFNAAVNMFDTISYISYREAFGSVDKEIKATIKELLEEGVVEPTAPKSKAGTPEFDALFEDTGAVRSERKKQFEEYVTRADAIQIAYENNLDEYYNKIQKKLDKKKINNEIDVTEMQQIYSHYLEAKDIDLTSNIGLPPIRKNKQAVDEALKVIIAKAAQSGLTKIVIPPADRIVAARGRELSTKEGDRFNRTYITDLNKSLKDLEDNYPVKIERLVELPYDDAGSDVDGLNLSKEGTVIDISELIANYKVEQPRQFAQGGLTMRDQMEMNFALGGTAETVDPVSGNDVPPGSLPVEVRDDIPARLSEGEYVVPADVVRYFGVRVFEEMRMEAKRGLQQMDADGRIGGEPMEPQVQQAELSDDDLNSIIEQAMQEQQPIMANEGTLVDSTSGAYKPPEVIQKYGLGLGSSLFDPNFGKNDFYDIGDYKPSTGDYDTAETIQDQAASTEPVCGINPMTGNQQVYNKALGKCVDRKTGDDEGPPPGGTTTTTTSTSWGIDKEGNQVDFGDPEALEKYIDSLNTPVDLPGTETLRDSAALAGKFIHPVAGLAIGAVSLYGKVDATTDIAGLRAGRITAAIYGHDKLVKDIEEKIAGYTGGTGFTRGGKFGDTIKTNDAVRGLFGTGFGFASKAHGSTNKEIKAFMEMVDNPNTDPEKLKEVREKLKEKSIAHRKAQRELAKISSDKEKFKRLEAARTAAQVAQQQAAARRNPNVIPGSGGGEGPDLLPSQVKSGYVSGNVRGLSNPQRAEIDRSSSKIDKQDADSFEDLNTGGLVQRRKKKK